MMDSLKENIFTNESTAFQLEDSQIVETIESYYMPRRVDFAKFLESYPFQDDVLQFHFVVRDEIVSWNTGIFGLKKIQGSDCPFVIVKEPLDTPVELNIQTLSALLMSYKPPAYLYKIGRIGTDSKTLRLLEKIISAEQPYFLDYF